MNNCQHCGSELESKRAKNCAQCNEVKQDAMKWNAYSAALDAMNSAQAAGMTGEAVREAGRDAIEQTRGMLSVRGAQERAEERAKREQRKARAALNSKLNAAGFTWMRHDEESEDAFGASAFEAQFGNEASVAWTLHAPDGRAVSVKEALAEIESSK